MICFYLQHCWHQTCRTFFTLTTNSLTLRSPAGSLMIQFNSDTNYLGLAQNPQVQGSVPQRLSPPPFQMPITRPPVLLTDGLQIEGAQDPFLRFNNLLGCRKTLYYYWIVVKDTTQKIQMKEMCGVSYFHSWARGASTPSLSTLLSQRLCAFTNLETLWTLFLGAFV